MQVGGVHPTGVRSRYIIFLFFYNTITVQSNIPTGFSAGLKLVMTALSDGTVAAFCPKYKQNKLIRFSLQTGQDISSANVNYACGMTEVELGGRSTIVVSH